MFEAIKDGINRLRNSRLFVLGVAMALLCAVLIQRIFTLQIVNGSQYLDNYTLTIKKDRETTGTRGNIYDKNGKLLAYNELSYSITFEDSEYYPSLKAKNKSLNAEIYEIIQMLSKNDESIVNDFSIIPGIDGKYEYSITGKTLKRFLADVYGRKTIEDLKFNKKLNYEEGESTPMQVLNYLRSEEKFGIKIKGVDDSSDKENSEDYHYYSEEDAYKILVIRYAISQNSYQKYVLTTIANGVSEKTIAMIKENSDVLPGVDISENTIRKYVNSKYYSHIIGYTGKVSQEEYEFLHEKDETYTLTDVVGKSGIEKEMEQVLQGTKGKEIFYVDNVGRIIEVIDKIDAGSGNNIYLSIDDGLQVAAYNILEQQLAGIIYSQIENIKNYNTSTRSSSSDIKIPVDDVYFALIENNVISINQFSDEDAAETQQYVHEIYLQKQNDVFVKIREQLTMEESVNYEDLEEEMQVYMSFILSMLTENKIFLTDLIDVKDEIYQEWKNDKTSLSKYLQHAIAMDWIDITNFNTESKYSDSNEIYDALLNYIQEELNNDLKFKKKLYKYMIQQDLISGYDICLILYEQEILSPNEEEINSLKYRTVSSYQFIKNKIKNLEITPAQLALDPCTGSMVITDVNTGKLLACVSYPGYDTNRLANTVDSEYFSSLQNDKSLPLYNNATLQRTAPGSTFKPITAAAGLTEGFIDTNTIITDRGKFMEVEPPPSCWIFPGTGQTHGNINVTRAIEVSCNYFFYQVAYEMGWRGEQFVQEESTDILTKYAKMFGFGEKTGIEIGESEPQISEVQPIVSAIGQGEHNFTSLSIARYATAVASKGNVYQMSLLDRITDISGETIEENKTNIVSKIDEVSDTSWSAIHEGMRLMVGSNAKFSDFTTVNVAGKTGTAQEIKTRPNHALFIGFAPYENPEIAIATRIAFGYTASNAVEASSDVLKYYFNLDDEDNLLSGQAQDVEDNELVD